MRPLPRLHAVTDAAVIAADDFPIRAAAIAAAGPAVALHARDRTAGGAALARVAQRLLALARPPEAAVVVNGRADVAGALGAQGVQLGGADLRPPEARYTPQRMRRKPRATARTTCWWATSTRRPPTPAGPARVSVWFATPRGSACR